MTGQDKKRLEREQRAKESYEQWRELSKEHWSHWRAWGSWFSWGSPVGLGIFFLLLALSAVALIWAIKL